MMTDAELIAHQQEQKRHFAQRELNKVADEKVAKLQAKWKDTWPKYRVTETCFFKDRQGLDRLYDPTSTQKDENGDHRPLYLETWGHPAHYMVPENEAAKSMWEIFTPGDLVDMGQALTPMAHEARAL